MKFHEDRCKGEAFMRLKPFYLTARLQTDGRKDRVIPVYPPPNFVAGGINRYWEQRLNCFYNLCVHLCQNKMYIYMYIKDTIYFTCINVEENRNLVQNFTTCPWRVHRKTKSRNDAKFTSTVLFPGCILTVFAGSICADLERK